MASTLSKDQIEEYKVAFSLFDNNGKGNITCKQLGKVLKTLHQTPSQDDLDKMIKIVDKDGNGMIDFEEFLLIMSKCDKNIKNKKNNDDELIQQFKIFDVDGNGFISASELRSVMAKLGNKLSDQEIADMIRSADTDGDGQVDYEEFVEMMRIK